MDSPTTRSSSDDSSKSILDTFDIEIASWKARIKDYASRSFADHLYSGSHLKRFSDFLQRSDTSDDNTEFAVLYDFQRNWPRVSLQRPSDLKGVVESNVTSKIQSQLLLMRGAPSPDWIAAIAVAFDVDPEFFEHHLRLDCGRAPNTWPTLSSAAAREPRLRFTTLGDSQPLSEKARKASHVQDLRVRATDLFDSYTRASSSHSRTGDSVLRGIRVHDSCNFSFQQDVSIWTRQTEGGWVAIAWLDFGCHNLADGPHGERLLAPIHDHTDSNVFRPVVFGRFREMDSNSNAHDRPSLQTCRYSRSHTDQISQNVLNLWHQYDSGLDLSLAKLDSFYALSKLFRMAAESDRQFLNTMQRLVDGDVEQANPLKDDDASMSNLQDHQHVLNKHKRLLRHNIVALQKHSSWPRHAKTDLTESAEIDVVARVLENDFNDLLISIEDTTMECRQGVRDLTNAANLAESQRAIAQAQGVELLTRLASVFLPLALLAAFFGMNFQEFGQGHLRLWVFAAIAAPTFVVSLFCLIPRLKRVIVVGWDILYSRRRKSSSEGDIEMGSLG